MTLQFDPHLVHDQFSLTQFWRQIAKYVWRNSTWHTFALIYTILAYHLWSSWKLNSSKWCVSFFVRYLMWYPTMWHLDKCRFRQPVQPPYYLRNTKRCLVSSLTVIAYLSDSRGSDQTARICLHRLVWAFAGRTYNIVGNVMAWLISC